MKIVCASLVASVAALGQEGDWQNYKATFGKFYNGLSDVTQRAVYEANAAIIAEQNAKGDGLTFGENQFTDMTQAQFEKSMGLAARPATQRTVLNIHQYRGEVIENSVDWVTAGAVTEVKNQGSCGSCWAFSTTGAVEGVYAVSSTGTLVAMSEQNLVDCDTAENAGCQGGLMDSAFEYLETHDIATEESYPYTGKEDSCKTSGTAAMSGSRVSGFVDVTPLDVNALMSAVQEHPVSIAIQANQLGFQLYNGGILTGEDRFQHCGQRLDHGVLLVGYGTEDDASSKQFGMDYWKVKNSWDTTFGEDGFIRVIRSDKNVCGIISEPSYPVITADVAV